MEICRCCQQCLNKSLHNISAGVGERLTALPAIDSLADKQKLETAAVSHRPSSLEHHLQEQSTGSFSKYQRKLSSWILEGERISSSIYSQNSNEFQLLGTTDYSYYLKLILGRLKGSWFRVSAAFSCPRTSLKTSPFCSSLAIAGLQNIQQHQGFINQSPSMSIF